MGKMKTMEDGRMDGSVNFYRPWNQYKRGFGNVEGEYWLGKISQRVSVCVDVHVWCLLERVLHNMYQLTRKNKYMLRVDLEDFTGRKGFALYSSFSVCPEADGYKLPEPDFTKYDMFLDQHLC
ncbi:hypothetical protein M9458_000317 [Cirrhinus mrigala]|uniref:Fibrinogen C-terminal domain-containing protein n=1 Tax=Cirrhinus mrigala TaxID=683832 RepID=A0ABD0RUY9_CIRMR